MPCAGPPDGKCSNTAKNKKLTFGQGELWLCKLCEQARFPVTTSTPARSTAENIPKSPGNKKSCKQCKKSTADKLLYCGRCEQWVCRKCSKATAAEYDMINKKSSIVHWFCSDCDEEAMIAIKASNLIEDQCKAYIESLEHKLQELNAKVEALTDGSVVADLNKRLTELSEQVENLQEPLSKKEDMDTYIHEQVNTEVNQKLSDTTAKAANISVQEMTQRENRKSNIVFFNIPESNSDDVEVRKADDLKHVTEITAFLGIDQSFQKPVRLGAKAERPRPLRVVASGPEAVTAILKAAKKMADIEIDAYKNVGIQRDMTFLEREQHRGLLKERKKRMEEAIKKGVQAKWVIRGGSLINLVKRNTQTHTQENTQNTD